MDFSSEQKVTFIKNDRWAVWHGGEYSVSESLKPAFKQIVNGGGGSKLGVDRECNFSHLPLNSENLENFSAIIYWALNPNKIEASDEFIEWYRENARPYEPIDWLNSCYGDEK